MISKKLMYAGGFMVLGGIAYYFLFGRNCKCNDIIDITDYQTSDKTKTPSSANLKGNTKRIVTARLNKEIPGKYFNGTVIKLTENKTDGTVTGYILPDGSIITPDSFNIMQYDTEDIAAL